MVASVQIKSSRQRLTNSKKTWHGKEETDQMIEMKAQEREEDTVIPHYFRYE